MRLQGYYSVSPSSTSSVMVVRFIGIFVWWPANNSKKVILFSLAVNPNKPVQCCLLKLHFIRLEHKTGIFPVLEMYITWKDTNQLIPNLLYQIIFILHHEHICDKTLRHHVADSRCFTSFELPELAMSTELTVCTFSTVLYMFYYWMFVHSYLLFAHFICYMR